MENKRDENKNIWDKYHNIHLKLWDKYHIIFIRKRGKYAYYLYFYGICNKLKGLE